LNIAIIAININALIVESNVKNVRIIIVIMNINAIYVMELLKKILV
jgi:hypothetical protein